MTKIEAYKEAKRIAKSVKSSTNLCLGRDTPNNDKHTFRCYFTGMANESWQPMKLQIHCSYGYYGSSSGYSATSEELGGYLARAIKAHSGLLLDYAAHLAEADCEKLRLAAEAEAREVLGETVKP